MTFTIKRVVINDQGIPQQQTYTVCLENEFLNIFNLYFHDIKQLRESFNIQTRLENIQNLRKL